MHGLRRRVREINLRGAKLARDVRESMGRDVFVLGSIGPLGKYLAPLGSVEPEEARAAFLEQAEGLLEGGVDAFVVETFSDLVEMQLAVEAIRALTDLPIVAQVAFTDDGVTFFGRAPPPRWSARCASCPSRRSAPTARSARARSTTSSSRCCRRPGGLPRRHPAQRRPAEPDGRAAHLPLLARVHGGLRGADGRGAARGWSADAAARRPSTSAPCARRSTASRPGAARPRGRARRGAPGWRPPSPPALPTTAAPTLLQRKLDAGEFLVTVELDPPRGHNIEKLVQGAKLLKERGVEIVDINDGSLGRVRMSVLPTAILVREATGLDINMHFTCRDRNLMGIQADVLGAHALDIRNILAMTGDPPRTGDYVNATAVFDVDAIGLIRILAGMNRGLDATGNSIGEPTSFCVGVGAQPGGGRARPRDGALPRQGGGGRAVGADPARLRSRGAGAVLRAARGSPIPVVVGILPLHSSRHAEFLHNEVPGITVPDAVRARMQEAGERGLRAGIETAQALARATCAAASRRRLPHAVVRPLRGRRRGARRAPAASGGPWPIMYDAGRRRGRAAHPRGRAARPPTCSRPA